MSARPITFYFRGQCQQIEMLAPTTTVLQYLREYVSAEKTRQTGTKEGCAEGLSLIHISEPTRHFKRSRMPSSA